MKYIVHKRKNNLTVLLKVEFIEVESRIVVTKSQQRRNENYDV